MNQIKLIARRLGAVIVFSGVLLTLAFQGHAVQMPAEDDYAALKTSLGAKLNLEITSVADSPIAGLKQINTDRGIFYSTADGNYFLQARIFNIENGIVDETEEALKTVRLEGTERFADSTIEFKAKNEKHVIYVFTDATCGYCRKLHNEIALINDMGITVRYLAWPRAGIGSSVYDDTVSIWCSEDQQKAMTDAKAGKSVADSSCENNVEEHFNFGRQVGVNGTPNIVLPNGTVVPGYQPAQTLLATIRDNS